MKDDAMAQAHLVWAVGIAALFFTTSAKAEDTTKLDMKLETITLSNPACEAVISVRPFVHLISFRLSGGKNHLINAESPNPLHNGQPMRPFFLLGAKLWYAPEVPGSHLLGLLSGKVTNQGGDVDARLDPDPASGLQGRIHFHLDEHEPRLTIESALRNVGSAEKETSCWWPVSFEPGGRMEAAPIPLPDNPAYSFHFWTYGGPASDPACQIGKDKVVLDLDRPLQAPVYKIGFLGREILVIKSDCTYRLTALDPVPSPELKYSHGGSPVMLFRDQKTLFCEAELSGPLAKLKPGEETAFTFSIALEKP